MEFTASQIASFIDGKIIGDENALIIGVSPIEQGVNGHFSFIAQERFAHFMNTSACSVLIVSENLLTQENYKQTIISVKDAYLSFQILMNLYQEMQGKKSGIEEGSKIHETAKIEENVYIGAFTYVSEKAKIGEGSMIYPQVYIGKGVKIGKNCKIDSGARIYTFNANVYQAGMPTSNISGYGSVSQSPADAFSSGFANGAAIGSAMRASMDRDTVYDGCMASLGWTTSKDISNAIYAERQNVSRQATETIQNDVPAPVLNAINNTAYLKKWYYEKSPKFDYAVDVDDKLKEDPEWGNKSLEERFAEATRLTRIHFGEISQ